MGKLGRLGLEPAERYERARPGELIHIDVKKLGRIQSGAGKRVRDRPEAPATNLCARTHPAYGTRKEKRPTRIEWPCPGRPMIGIELAAPLVGM